MWGTGQILKNWKIFGHYSQAPGQTARGIGRDVSSDLLAAEKRCSRI